MLPKILFTFFLVLIQPLSAKKLVIPIDIEKSKILWIGRDFINRYKGTIKFKSGFFKMKKNKVVSGKFVIDMNTINCTNVNFIFKKKIEKRLISKDFFWIEKYPTAEFTAKIAKNKSFIYDVKGKLRLRGKANSLFLKSQISFTNGYPTKANGIIFIDRTDWGVNFLGPKENYISKEIELEFIIFTKWKF